MTDSNNQQNKDQTSGQDESLQNDELETENGRTSESEEIVKSEDTSPSAVDIDEDGITGDDYVDDDYVDDDAISLEKEASGSDDDEFFETHYEQHDPDDEAFDEDDEEDDQEPKVIKPASHDDDAASLYAGLHGVEGVYRQNAQLMQAIKTARRQNYMSLAVSASLAIVCFAMIMVFLEYPKTRYIPTTDNKAICEVTPENNPNITDVAISDFAKDALLNLYTFDYVNFEDQINDSLARWFSGQGRVDTINAMTTAGITEYVQNNALTLRAGTTAAAKIERKGRTSLGDPYWVVRFPMVVDVYSGGDRPEDTQSYVVSVRVVAGDATAQNPKGLAIASAALEPRS